MEAKFWQKKWDEDSIGFHQATVNKRLEQYWPKVLRTDTSSADRVTSAEGSCVFVPLCGKSLDMLWLHSHGHKVLGVELSEKAVKAFFDENKLGYEVRETSDFIHYEGMDNASGISILVGDFFAMRDTHCQECVTYYDRAAMIAMEPQLRRKYAAHLSTVLPSGARGLLLTIDYDQAQMKGPPFSVSDENVTELLGGAFYIEELALFSGPRHVGSLAQRGLETLDERVYLLNKR